MLKLIFVSLWNEPLWGLSLWHLSLWSAFEIFFFEILWQVLDLKTNHENLIIAFTNRKIMFNYWYRMKLTISAIKALYIIFIRNKMVIPSIGTSKGLFTNIYFTTRYVEMKFSYIFNPYPWILEKKSKTRDRHRARFAEKKI